MDYQGLDEVVTNFRIRSGVQEYTQGLGSQPIGIEK